MQKVQATGGQSHANCIQVAASRMQIVPAWPPVACNMNKIDGNLPATGGHIDKKFVKVANRKIEVEYMDDIFQYYTIFFCLTGTPLQSREELK